MAWIKDVIFWLFGMCLLVILSIITPVAWWLLYMDVGSPKGAWTATSSDKRNVSVMMFLSLVAWVGFAVLVLSCFFGTISDQLPTRFVEHRIAAIGLHWLIANVAFGFGIHFHSKNSFMRNPTGAGVFNKAHTGCV